MSKPYIYHLHIHSSCSSWSSTDKFLKYKSNVPPHKLFDITTKVLNLGTVPAHREQFVLAQCEELGLNNGVVIPGGIALYFKYTDESVEKEHFKHVFLEEISLYWLGLNLKTSHNLSQEFDRIISYLINHKWSEKLDSKTEELIDTEHKLAENRRLNKRKKLGHVIIKWSKDLKPEDYKGSISDEVFNQKVLQDYLKNGGCHGYIGASERTFEIDKQVEAALRKRGLTPGMIAEWFTWSSGRHYADQLSPSCDVEEFLDEYLVSFLQTKNRDIEGVIKVLTNGNL